MFVLFSLAEYASPERPAFCGVVTKPKPRVWRHGNLLPSDVLCVVLSKAVALLGQTPDMLSFMQAHGQFILFFDKRSNQRLRLVI